MSVAVVGKVARGKDSGDFLRLLLKRGFIVVVGKTQVVGGHQENPESDFMQLCTTYAFQWNYSSLHPLPSDSKRFRWDTFPQMRCC